MNTQEQTQEIKSSDKNKKFNSKYLIISVIIVLIIIVGFFFWLYMLASASVQRAVFSKAPFPVAFVKTAPIYGSEYYKRLDLAKQLLANNNLPKTDLEASMIEQLVDNKKLDILAKQKNIKVSDEDIEASFQKVLASYGTEDEKTIADELQSNYGISLKQFKNEVLRQTLLQEGLALWHNQQEQLNSGAYDKARDLLSKLDNGKTFDEVAKTYTADEASKDFAGDTGFIAYSAMLPEFQAVVKDVNLNEPKLIASRFGLHIITVTAIQNGEDAQNIEQKSFQIKQIFIKPGDLEAWLNSELSKISSLILI